MKRIATYCFYDSRGEVARHKVYYLSQLVKVLDRLVIVCNGELTAEGRDTLEQFTPDVLVRENEGFDFWAHKTGLEYIGWDTLSDYDEYLLCSDICYGPIYPFEELFEEMGKRDCDFWGVMYNYEDKKALAHGEVVFPGGYQRDFILSPLINVKSKMLKSYEFRQHWDNLVPIGSYSEAVVNGEFWFTYNFQNSGFRWDCIQGESLRDYVFGEHTNAPYQVLTRYRTPIIRKKALNGVKPLSDSWFFGYGDEYYKTLEYIERNTEYDSGLIWDDILHKSHLSDVQERLQLEYILPSSHLEHEYSYKKKIAVICHIYYADLVEECASYSDNFPEGTDFYLTTTSEETLAEIHKEFGRRGHNYQVQMRPNVGRDAPTLFVTYSHIVTGGEYEYICYFHDKKASHFEYKVIGEQSKLRCYTALFGSKDIVKNIINKFEANLRLGVVANPPPYQFGNFNCLPSSWRRNYEEIEKLAERIELDVPLSEEKYAPSAYGAKLWFRADALKKMLSYNFIYDDFSTITAGINDGEFEHAIERIYGLAAQDSGYYLAYVLSDTQARSELANYQAMLFGNEGIVNTASNFMGARVGGYSNFLHTLCGKLQITFPHSLAQQEYLETIPAGLLFKKLIKRFVPSIIWRPLANRRNRKSNESLGEL
ncbi:MAG: rhamnan synthesis F family protein [Coriobacteriia bacterium]|nr:rhamnan synthesis F family protein [Coriobacteriia bacterium]